jgi:ribonuclease T2
MPLRRLAVTLLLFVWLLPGSARATIKLDGYLIAGQACPALQSIRKGTNPGEVTLTPQRAYTVIGKNKPAASHYLLRIEEASPSERWVAVGCGRLLTDCRERAPADGGGDEGGVSRDYLLAVSWQPAFCQTHQGKRECETQHGGRFDADHFSLHGLWPQPRGNTYCQVSNLNRRLDDRGLWEQLPALGLAEETLDALLVVMPGVASHLHRHEWYKHGTCYSDSPEEYYQESLSLMAQLNDSPVRGLFASQVGRRLSAAAIREAFDVAFGEGAGERVEVGCDDGMLSELWINMRGEVERDTSLGALIRAAEPVAAGCDGGRVDPVGF